MSVYAFGAMRSVDARMGQAMDLGRRLARTPATILIQGETGTGKDVLAHAIHAESGRSGELVILDCGTIPHEMAETVLFGHERGAFTGAINRHAGLIEQAEGGTLFLDEVNNLPLDLQPKLLRAIEAKSVRRVGGAKTIAVNTRIVAASNINLLDAVNSTFRADLFYRLAVGKIILPSLQDRPEDIPFLAALFAESFEKRLTESAMLYVCSLSWPGNVRELKNTIEAAAYLADGPEIDRTGLMRDAELFGEVQLLRDTAIENIVQRLVDSGLNYHEAKQRFTCCYAQRVISKFKGNQSAAARWARIDRRYLRALAEGKTSVDKAD